jgi:hypothetical protein
MLTDKDVYILMQYKVINNGTSYRMKHHMMWEVSLRVQ